MLPSTLRALVGQVIAPNMPALNTATIRFRVLGFGVHDVRVQTLGNGARSEIAIDVLVDAIARGDLIVLDK